MKKNLSTEDRRTISLTPNAKIKIRSEPFQTCRTEMG